MLRNKISFKRRVAFLIALAMMLTMVVPAMAASVGSDDHVDNRSPFDITIHNRKNLPHMESGQFVAYQIFKGDLTMIPDPTNTPDGTMHDPDHKTELSHITWGANIKTDDETEVNKLVQALKTAFATQEYFKDIQPISSGLEGTALSDALAAQATAVAAALAGIANAEDLQLFAKTIYGNKNGGNAGSGATWLTGSPLSSTTECQKQDGDPAYSHKPEECYSQIKNCTPGYYLITEAKVPSVGDDQDENEAVSEFILRVVGDVDIYVKADVPTVDKSIEQSGGNSNGDSASIGDEVQFKLDGTLPANYGDFTEYFYQFVDKLSSGIDYIAGSLKVTVGGVELKCLGTTMPSPIPQGADLNGYYLEYDSASRTLKVTFPDLKKVTSDGGDPGTSVTIDKDTHIIVTYKAKINKDAQLGSTGNDNKVHIVYSNDPNSDGKGKSTTDIVYEYVFGLDIHKIGNDEAHQSGLNGAEFRVKDASGNFGVFEKDGDNYKLIGWVTNPDNAEQVKALLESKGRTDLLTGEDTNKVVDTSKVVWDLESKTTTKGTGYLQIRGLGDGTYTIIESVAPSGYNTMNPVEIKIECEYDTDGKLKKVTVTRDNGDPKVYDADHLPADFSAGIFPDVFENRRAPGLPETGGIGTTIFYVLGAMLLVGVAAYLVISSSKKKESTK